MPLTKQPQKPINPELIEIIAAEVFWNACFKFGYQKVSGYVKDGQFRRLWTLQNAAALLHEYASSFDAETVKRIYQEVNDYMMSETVQERNIIGMIYTEDFAHCLPPQFPHVDLIKKLAASFPDEKKAESTNIAIPVVGELLIRTPLPAVVLLKSRPSCQTIRVKSTQKALGFQKNLFLGIQSLSSLPDNPQGYLLGASGVFHIPCNETTQFTWLKLVPNAIACRSFQLIGV